MVGFYWVFRISNLKAVFMKDYSYLFVRILKRRAIKVHKPCFCGAIQQGKEGPGGPVLKCEVGAGAHPQGRSWPWTTYWPVGSAAAAPPPLASAGASQRFHQLSLHFA